MALQHLRSGVANKRPIPTIMSEGQIALNTNEASPGLFFKDSNGDLVKIGPVHIGTTAPNSSPASTAADSLVTGATYQILTVGTSDFTLVGASANTIGVIFTATGTTTGTGTVSGQQDNEKGEQWLDTSLTPNELKVYNGTAWVSATGQEIPVSKLANGTAYQLLQTDSAGTGVEWTSNIDVPGTLDVTGVTTLDSTLEVAGLLSADGRIELPAGTESTPSLSYGADAASGTGMFFPASGEIAFALGGNGHVFITGSGRVGFNEDNPDENFVIGNIAGDSTMHLKCGTTTGRVGTIFFGNGKEGRIAYSEGNDNFTIETNSTEQIRISNLGQVTIGELEANDDSEVVLIKNGQAAATDTLTTILAPSTSGKSVLNFGDTGNYRVGRIEYTHNDNSLKFFTQATASTGERMCINNSGNVGIGTTSPLASSGLTGITTSGSTGGIYWLAKAGAQKGYLYGQDNDVTLASTDSSGVIRLLTGGNNERMRIDSSGKVGIGTTSPTNQLHIYDGTAANDQAEFKIESFRPVIRLKDRSASSASAEIVGDNALKFSVSAPVDDDTALTERMRITSSGNVGIGTTSPSTKVHIADAAAPEFRIVDTTNNCTGFMRPVDSSVRFGTGSNHPLEFHVNSSERMRIDSSGNVGIGTTSPSQKLHVVTTSVDAVVIQRSGAGGGVKLDLTNGDNNTWDLFNDGGELFNLRYNDSAKVVVNSSGNVGIGRTSPAQNLDVASTNNIAYALDGWALAGKGDASDILFGGVLSSQFDTLKLYTSGSERMRIDSSGNIKLTFPDGNTGLRNKIAFTTESPYQDETAYIAANRTASSFAPTDLVFATGTSSGTSEKMRIDSSGNVGIGTTSPQAISGYTVLTLNNATQGGAIEFKNNGTSYGRLLQGSSSVILETKQNIPLLFKTNNTERMRIASDGSIFAYNLSGSASAGAALKLISNEIYRDTSSIQFKKDVEDIEEFYATNLLENARPAWFRAKEDENPEHSYYGFIAEELAEVEPRLCVFEDGEPFSVDYAKFTPLLLKLLQMQNAHIKSLETKLETLEQRLTDAGL